LRESLAHRALACQGSGRPVDRRLRTRSRSQTRSRSWSGLVVLDQVCDHPMRHPLRAALRSLLTFFMVAPLLRSLAGSGREPLRRSSDGRFINWCSINRRLATCAASNQQPPCCTGLRGWWHTLVRAAPRWHHPDSTLRLASPPTLRLLWAGRFASWRSLIIHPCSRGLCYHPPDCSHNSTHTHTRTHPFPRLLGR
jgi:hypothetical protein